MFNFTLSKGVLRFYTDRRQITNLKRIGPCLVYTAGGTYYNKNIF